MSLVGFKAQNHPQQKRKAEIDDRATPPEMFNPLHERFRFTLDVCAELHNTKLPRFYSPELDGLKQPWAGERVWCNPPYSNIRPWVEKAWWEEDARIVVMLLPANRTEQRWWQELVEGRHRDRPSSRLRCEFLPGRPRFICRGETAVLPNQRPPFGCCLLIWTAS